MFFIAGAGDSAKGFSVRYFRLLRAIIPILDDDTPEILQQRASDADMLSEYLALRAEHNRDGRRLFTRLRTLRLASVRRTAALFARLKTASVRSFFFQ